ncbi:MAG: LPXTG cell wall anchor domain-containing protein, partial [Erysipelotrichaceae bacterium]|nr:LPXTG cell wall anchor domain-containing protein [Erysipelotrichaceae bacterium]
LPVEGLADFSKYVIYEVKLTDPAVDSEGKVTSYSALELLDDGRSIALNGTQVGDTSSSVFDYTVNYERGKLSSNNNVRVDEVTNSRPGIIIKKTKWDGTTALQGAVFTMKDEDNNLIGTYTSDEDGLIVEAFLRENVKYYLTETSAPQGWQGLLSDMTIKLNGEIIVIGGVDDDYYMVSTDATTDTKIITVKNRPYEFKVVKMDKGTGKPLQGVKFALYREIVVDSVHSWDPNPYPGYESLTSGNDGIVISRPLPAGKYQLRETKALSGYQTLSGYITFTISSTGVIELDSNTPEEATLTYDTDENGSVLYQITITNTKEFKVSIWKTNEGYETITSGASFKLYKAEDYNDTTSTIKDGAIPLVSGTTGENGILALGTLTVGVYRLIETAAPAGYNMAESAIRISVKNNGVTALQEGNLSDVYKKGDQYWVVGQDNATWQIRVWNNPGVELPHTGGIGTTIFRMAGLTLILTVGIVLIFKKRH